MQHPKLGLLLSTQRLTSSLEVSTCVVNICVGINSYSSAISCPRVEHTTVGGRTNSKTKFCLTSGYGDEMDDSNENNHQ